MYVYAQLGNLYRYAISVFRQKLWTIVSFCTEDLVQDLVRVMSIQYGQEVEPSSKKITEEDNLVCYCQFLFTSQLVYLLLIAIL